MPGMRGGMEFRQGAIVRVPPPPRTLEAHPVRLGCAMRPQVQEGEVVRRGQLLADAPSSDCACTFSPIGGAVRAIASLPESSAPTAARARYELTIEPDETTVATTLATEPPRGRTLDNWFDTLRRFGPWREGDPRLDLLPQLLATRERRPTMLICNGIDLFPPYPDRSSLLASFPDDAVLGTQIIADIVGARRVLMVASHLSSVIGRLKPSCRNFRVPLSATNNVYPSGDPTMVLWMHARRKLPRDALTTERGVVMIGPWTAIRLARWFTNRELDLARPLLIGWPERTPMTPCYALPGQPLASVHGSLAGGVAALAGRVLWGNPMTGLPVATPQGEQGIAVADAPADGEPVTPNDHLLLSIIAPAKELRREHCISCGWCAEVCPTELRPIRLVQMIHQRRAADKPLGRRTERHLRWCIDCGLCSHVCPADLPLAQTLRRAFENQ